MNLNQSKVYLDKLLKLERCLPDVFSPVLRDVLERLGEIIDLPKVLTHNDLSCSNILVNPAIGNIAGVVDWAHATVHPFGLALWGLHDVTGSHNDTGHHYKDEADVLVAWFRNSFVTYMGYRSDMLVLE